MAGKMTDREAAEAVGIDPERASYVKAKPRVKRYMAEHRASVRAGLVQHEVETLAEFNIGREQMLAKWWEFANIDPKLTGYNTSSQSKALDSLWEAMGYQDSVKAEQAEQAPQPDVYRAKWLRQAQGEDVDEEGEGSSPAPSSAPPSRPPAPTLIERSPATVPEAATMCPSREARPRAVEPEEPPYRPPSAAFGRFQGL